MTADVMKDFDEAQRDRKDEVITFKKAGKVYKVPSSPPSQVMFDALHVHENYQDSKEIPSSLIEDVLNRTLGEENAEQLKADTQWSELEEIFEWLWDRWQSEEGADDQGKASVLSKSGASSKQTSNGSMEST